jgi:enamine deaminase RidA (YjgF/YER057c/UK114 family)
MRDKNDLRGKQTVNPPSLFDSKPYGFSQAVITPFLTERPYTFPVRLPWMPTKKLIGVSNLAQQTRQSLKNLDLAVEAAGGTIQHVVMLRLYVVKPKPGDTTIVGEILREYFGTQNPPASTWIGVTSLAREEFLIEIEATAVV